jgi:2-phospho-L-lactate/phosphoenolpyruvate guanylyltransferase
VAEAAARGERVRVLRDTEQSGQSAAASIGIRYALASGFERVLLVPGDTPLLDPGEVAELLARGDSVSIVPDRHGTGTNALVLAPPDAIEPSFGPGSRARHVAAAEAAGLPHAVEEVPTLMLDVDTGEDLAVLAGKLEARRGEAPSTRGALRQLDRSRASRRAAVPA